MQVLALSLLQCSSSAIFVLIHSVFVENLAIWRDCARVESIVAVFDCVVEHNSCLHLLRRPLYYIVFFFLFLFRKLGFEQVRVFFLLHLIASLNGINVHPQ